MCTALQQDWFLETELMWALGRPHVSCWPTQMHNYHLYRTMCILYKLKTENSSWPEDSDLGHFSICVRLHLSFPVCPVVCLVSCGNHRILNGLKMSYMSPDSQENRVCLTKKNRSSSKVHLSSLNTSLSEVLIIVCFSLTSLTRLDWFLLHIL